MTLTSMKPEGEDRPITTPTPTVFPRRQDTLVTHGPTQDSTEQRTTGGTDGAVARETAMPVSLETSRTVIRDIVGEHRRRVSQAIQILWFVIGICESLIALRLVLKFSGANPGADFTQFIYGITKPLVSIFLGIFPNLASGSMELEPASAVALVAYFLIGLGVARLIWILYGEPREMA